MSIKNKILIFFALSALMLMPVLAFHASAQTATDEIIVNTMGYSVPSLNVVIFNGSYSKNTLKKPLTTYFEYKKGSPNLDVGADETVKIIRNSNVKENGNFYTNPELANYATYYFRAVGYYNEDPSKKFYGGTASVQTGTILGNITIPYTFNVANNITVPYIPPIQPFCLPPEVLVDNVCKASVDGAWSKWSDFGSCSVSACGQRGVQTRTRTCTPPQNGGKACSQIDGGNASETQVCETAACTATTNNTPNTPNSSGKKYGGLVECGNKGQDPCGFFDILKLINTLIDFTFKVLVVPIAAILFAFAGLKMIISGGSSPEARSAAKEVLINTVIGLAIAAGSFLIIKTLLLIIGFQTGGDWASFIWL